MRSDLLVHEAAETVTKGLVLGGEKRAFDHGSLQWLSPFLQSNCLVK
jgi:hypothetical protein